MCTSSCWSWCKCERVAKMHTLRKWHRNVNFNKFNALHFRITHKKKTKKDGKGDETDLHCVFFFWIWCFCAYLQWVCIVVKCQKRQSICIVAARKTAVIAFTLTRIFSSLFLYSTYKSPSAWNHLFLYNNYLFVYACIIIIMICNDSNNTRKCTANKNIQWCKRPLNKMSIHFV